MVTSSKEMQMSKSAATVLKTLKEELGAGNPEEVLDKVQNLKAISEKLSKRLTDSQGPLSLTLSLNRATAKYSHAMTAANDLPDLLLIQTVIEHFRAEILGPAIRQLEVEAEVQRRLEDIEEKQPTA